MRRVLCLLLLIPSLLLSACTFNNCAVEEDMHSSTANTSELQQIKRVVIPEGYCFWQIAQRL